MDYTERQPARFPGAPLTVAGEWYLRGFADAYDARWAIAPSGPAGEQYRKGYALGQQAFQREFFEALQALQRRLASSDLVMAEPVPRQQRSMERIHHLIASSQRFE